MSVIKSNQLIILYIVVVVVISSFFMVNSQKSTITGNIVAKGGQVSRLDLQIESTPHNYWTGIYGNLANIYTEKEIILDGTQEIINLNLNLMKCYFTEIYATTLTTIDWNSIIPAEPSDVDLYINLPDSNLMSGTKVFTDQKNFIVNGQKLFLYYTTTNSETDSYDIGILKSGNIPIFVSNIKENTSSFNNVLSDFQIMLPVSYDSEVTYNFFQDPFDSNICEENNGAPTITEISDLEFIEDSLGSIIITVNDPDEDFVTLTTDFDFEISQIGQNEFKINWTPTNNDVGNHSVYFRVTDNYNHSTIIQKTFFVKPVNDAPIIELTEDIYGYEHIQLTRFIKGNDEDLLNNYIEDDNVLEFDTSPHYSWLNFKTYKNTSNFKTEYYGMIDFYPLTNHRGNWPMQLTLTDGISSYNQNITINIGFCGNIDETNEPVCESDFEDCLTCETDCGKCGSSSSKEYLTIEIQNRNCVNKTITAQIFNLVKRGECDIEGKIINNREVCGNATDINVKLFELINKEWIEIAETTSDENGYVNFDTNNLGSYKLVTDDKDYYPAYRYFGMNTCMNYLKLQEQIIPKIIIDEIIPEKEEILDKPSVIRDVPAPENLFGIYAIIIFITLAVINIGYHYRLGKYDNRIKQIKHFKYTKSGQKLRHNWYIVKDFLGF